MAITTASLPVNLCESCTNRSDLNLDDPKFQSKLPLEADIFFGGHYYSFAFNGAHWNGFCRYDYFCMSDSSHIKFEIPLCDNRNAGRHLFAVCAVEILS